MVVDGVDMLFAVFGLLEDFLGAKKKSFAAFCESNGVGSAEKEFAMEFFFKRFDVLGDCGLGDVTASGCNGERACLGDKDK